MDRRNEPDIRKALAYFEQALREDPNYALAYVGLAAAFTNLSIPGSVLPPQEASQLATEALMKALSLDPMLGEAHRVLAFVKREFDWDWRSAEQESKRAIELSPNSSRAHLGYCPAEPDRIQHRAGIADRIYCHAPCPSPSWTPSVRSMVVAGQQIGNPRNYRSEITDVLLRVWSLAEPRRNRRGALVESVLQKQAVHV